jgi:hypothetical protein
MCDLALIQNSEDLIDAYRRLVDAASNDDEDTYQQAAIIVDRLVYEIGTTVPETISGFQAKAQAALVLWACGEADISSGDKETALARSLVRDLAWMPVQRSKAPRSRPRLIVIEGGLKASA